MKDPQQMMLFKSSERPLHFLINNAGVLCRTFEKDIYGDEIHFSTNHLGTLSSYSKPMEFAQKGSWS